MADVRGRNQVRGARYRGCCPRGLHALGPGRGPPGLACWLAAGRCLPTTTIRGGVPAGVDHLQRCRLVPELARRTSVRRVAAPPAPPPRCPATKPSASPSRCLTRWHDGFAGRARAELARYRRAARPRSLGTRSAHGAEAQIAGWPPAPITGSRRPAVHQPARTVETTCTSLRKLGVTSRVQARPDFADHKQTPAWQD